MTPVEELLFGKFPRDAGTPSRFTLFSPHHYNEFLHLCKGKYNLYCSISWNDIERGWISNKISFDLDTPSKDETGTVRHERFNTDMNEKERISRMMNDSEIANDILGPVVDDMNTLAKQLLDDEIPCVGIFTGFGVHIHLIYEETESPYKEMKSTVNRYRKILGLETVDMKPIGDIMRIMRIPNCRRICSVTKEPTDVWTVPLTITDMVSYNADDVIASASSPQDFPPSNPAFNEELWPEMEVFEEYLKTESESETKPFDEDMIAVNDDFLEYYLADLIKMPCVYERAMTANPDHPIRIELAIMMFNLGFNVDSVHSIIKQLDWLDYKPRMTEKQLRQIYRRKYASKGCKGMREDGYCTRSDEPKKCPAYGWKGGQVDY